MTLPIVDAPCSRTVASEEDSSKNTRLRVLIVDDNRDSADTLTLMLRMRGNETQTAYDGEEAVRLAAEFSPDVILLDIGLPKLNGYDACRRIRQMTQKEVVIIAQTGWGQSEDRHRTKDAGFDHHIVKPIDIAQLFRLLTEVADAKSKK